MSFQPAPPALLRMFTSDDDFRTKIRAYNSAFAFTSLGASKNKNVRTDDSVMGSRGVYTFRVQGGLCHRLGSLLPMSENARPTFAQIYIADPDAALRATMRAGVMDNLHGPHLQVLESIMEEYNPYAKQFLNAGEIIRMRRRELRAERQLLADSTVDDAEEAMLDMRLHLHNSPSNDPRTHNLPTISEVAAILIEDENIDRPRDLILRTKQRGFLRIFETSPAYDPLQYPLLFPYGEPGWHYSDKYLGPQHDRTNKKTVALREFVAYRLHERKEPTERSGLLHEGGRLFQQYVVDQCAKVEQERLRYVKTHQKELRADQYFGLRDLISAQDVHVQGGDPNNPTMQLGKRLILPPSFTGGPRYMYEQYLNAMATVREFGSPDLFITMTCNPDWDEIKQNIQPHQTAQDRPDIVCRVWQPKLNALLKDIEEGVLGVEVARIHVIEFQKRGLPHAHILVILSPDDKPKSAELIDRMVSAELPDPNKHPQLYETVLRSMMHGPCGQANPNCVCMKDGKCSKKFPRDLSVRTEANVKGYPVYKRRERISTPRILQQGSRKWENKTANQWVVPYNPYFAQKYNSHINVEVCTSITAVKYIYKYAYKGPDKITITLEGGAENRNELKEYKNGRYISPIEACQRLLDYPIQAKTHTVVALPVHTKDRQIVTWRDGTTPEIVLRRAGQTMLTQFFELCQTDELAATMLYKDIPKKFRWDKSRKVWVRYKKYVRSIGRMIHCTPKDIERFYLRLMLCHRPGPTSFEDLRTVDGRVYPTYKEAALAAGFLENDAEWSQCLQEAVGFKMPYQLRQLFTTILVYSQPADIGDLWNKFKNSMTEDYQRQLGTRLYCSRLC